jgi:glycosyltransferase involved in cell wall biosynthesis
MKILTVIHGYPNYYMAGSEVYTYNICNELAKTNDVEIFTRYENSYEDPYSVINDIVNGISVTRVNKPDRDYTFRDKYIDEKIDILFKEKLNSYKPDVVYIGHLSHLSTNIPIIAKEFGAKVVFTIHDFWMGCYRGQLITSDKKNCSGTSIEACYKCAKTTYKEWIKKEEIIDYQNHLKNVMDSIDIFLAPSQAVYNFYKENGVSETKLIYSKYGFDTKRIDKKEKFYTKNSKLNFGFMGRVIPVKGMKTLFEAFRNIEDATLTIYGSQADKKYLDLYSVDSVKYYGAYNNNDINKVLSEIDVLIVPSIWPENSPLVIQEAFLAGIPVITSNFGGMKELVTHEKDGWLFEAGNSISLNKIVKEIIMNPEVLNKIRGDKTKVRTIEDDAKVMASYFKSNRVLKHHNFPWRITFDTNPGICNLRCQMCEVHSDYNTDRVSIKELPVMDFKVIEEIVLEGASRGLKEIIPSTMGEPLLYKDFEKMVDLCKKTGIKMNLTTNGTFPGKTVNEWAHILLPICSDIKISQNEWIDNPNPTIMKGTTPKNAFNSMKEFLRVREELSTDGIKCATLTSQVTFLKKNLDDIEKIIENYSSMGVDRVKGHHLWITWEQLHGEAIMESKELIEEWNAKVDRYFSKAKDMKLQNFDKISIVSDLKTNDNNKLCPFLGKEAWIAPDGTFNVCCAPDKERKTLGYYGNVLETQFSTLWHSKKYKELVNNWGAFSVCKKCNMRVENRGE